MKKLTTEEFIKRSNRIFNDEYIYNKTEYVNAKTKCIITCKIHGDFLCTPSNHLNGRGCPKCRYIKSALKNKNDIHELIKKAEEIHNGKYDYSLITEYNNNRQKLPIICYEKDKNGVEHGIFYQSMDKHIIRQHGCPKCNCKIRTREIFIEDSIKIHGNNINYDNVVYNGVHNKVLLECNVCGNKFWQTPHDHLQGNGCPFCKESKLEKSVALFLDNNNIKYKRWYRYDINEHRTSLDFFIEKYKIGIECQGEQHFQPVKFKGKSYDIWAEEEFKKNILRDKRKFDKCNELKIKLFYYIPNVSNEYLNNNEYNGIYTKYNVISNIEDILKYCK